MSRLTNEQIQAILDGAPEHATHYIDGRYWCINEVQIDYWDGKYWNSWEDLLRYTDEINNLSDLREILTLRQEVGRLKARQSEVAAQYPMQPVIKDMYGRDRFEANPIIDWLCTDVSNMNDIAFWCAENDIDPKYQEQLAQLIGYSVYGYGTLSYVSDESYERANKLREQSDE